MSILIWGVGRAKLKDTKAMCIRFQDVIPVLDGLRLTFKCLLISLNRVTTSAVVYALYYKL